MVQKSQRLPHIVLLQAFGVILVLLGHVFEPFSLNHLWYDVEYPKNATIAPLYRWIYSFHMPLFFFISGYLFAYKKYYKKNWGKYIKNRIQRLIVPFFVFGAIVWLPFFHWYLHKPISSVTDFIFLYCGHLWFLPSLFVSLLIYSLLLKTPLRRDPIILTFAVLFIYYFFPPLSLPLIIYQRPLLHLVYVHLGYLFAQYFTKGFYAKNIHLPFYNASLILIGLWIVNVLAHSFLLQLRFISTPIFIITFCYVIALGLVHLFPTLSDNKIITYLFKNMMTIYLWHYLPCIACQRFFMKHLDIPPIISAGTTLLIIVLSVILVIWVYDKLKQYIAQRTN